MNYFRHLFLVTICISIIVSNNCFATETVTLPEPTGSFSVGRALQYIKTDRDELWTEIADDKRELPLLIWYPTDIEAGISPEYLPYGNEVKSDRFDAVKEWSSKLTVNSFHDAPIANTPKALPIIVFSPGNGTGPWAYHMVLEDLASHGFVVIGIDHTYQGSGQVLSDGTIINPAPGVTFNPKAEESSEEFEKEVKNWYMGLADVQTDDIQSVVAALYEMNENSSSIFHKRLDLSRIGALGHSMGGIAAAHALEEVDGISSGVNIDGHFANLTFDPARTPSKIFMVIEAEEPIPSDEILAKEGYTREKYTRAMRTISNQQAATYRQIKGGAFRVVIDGASHSSVHDSFLITAQDSAYRGDDPLEIVKAARIYLLAFFEKTLLNKTSTALDTMLEDLYSFTYVEKFENTEHQ